jgi:hypothetical protein
VTWTETASETFVARHGERDADDAVQVLRQLEGARIDLERRFGVSAGELEVVLHGTEAQLDAATPWLPLLRRLTAPAGRRYLVGWASEHELHVLAPRVLAGRASNVEGSLEMLMLTPTALVARRLLAERNPALPPPFGPRAFARYLRWGWLIEGAAQWFSGQTRHARPAIARRLREGRAPSFPPSRPDAPLLGGSLFDLLAREEGEHACVELVAGATREGAERALVGAFHGRPLRHTEAAWRSHLARLSEQRRDDPRRHQRDGDRHQQQRH